MDQKVEKFIYASSSSVYGNNKDLQLKLLETQIQISKDEKVDYGAIEKYIRINDYMKYVDEGLLKKSNIIEMFHLDNEFYNLLVFHFLNF